MQERITETRSKALIGMASVLLIAGFSIAYGQIREDMMDPEEIGFRDIESLTIPEARYVGNEVCMTCHEAAYRKWLETKHSRSFVPMRSTMAMIMGEKAGVTACCPAKSGKCLPCHATAHDVPADYRGPQFRMGEGVSCEKCHGPGGRHVETVGGGKASLLMPTEKDCMVCHAPKPSHAMVCSNCHRSREDHVEMMMRGGFDPLDVSQMSEDDVCLSCHRLNPSHMTMMEAEPFSFEAVWKRIAHPEDRNKASKTKGGERSTRGEEE